MISNLSYTDIDSVTDAIYDINNQLSVREKELPGFRETYLPGISVIIPTHNGKKRIVNLLNSLVNQTLSYRFFEVIVIENGDVDGTKAIVDGFRLEYPRFQVRYFYHPQASASAARNIGLAVARMSKTTFVDDDDTIQPRFLEEGFSLSSDNSIVVLPILELSEEGQLDSNSIINQRISDLPDKSRIIEHPWLFSFNACKIAPTKILQNISYAESLRSGEDIVYWAHLLAYPHLRAVPVRSEESSYVRLMRSDSVSRRTFSWDFSIKERIEVIKELTNLESILSPEAIRVCSSLKRGQAGFIHRYLMQYPKDYNKVANFIEEQHISRFPWGIVNHNVARDLAFLYCFPPYNDTSGMVAAKVLVDRKYVVDVVSQDMSAVRPLDTRSLDIVARWIDNHHIIRKPSPSFSNWNAITEFAQKAVMHAEGLAAEKGSYNTLYSRSFWLGSHVAAALYKLRHWDITWTAEFSDPIRFDDNGKERTSGLVNNEVFSILQEAIRSRGFPTYETNDLFDLIETSTVVFADELIFTNSNQLDYMCSVMPDKMLSDLAYSKAIVREHPQPPEWVYRLGEPAYELDMNYINLAYFGVFYKSRSIADVLHAISLLPSWQQERLRFHVFSKQVEEVVLMANKFGLSNVVIPNPYLDYLDFLRMLPEFDVLVVNDVKRGDDLPINPFLPSKYADYSGSGTDIWAILDEGSPLSQRPVTYKSDVGDVDAAVSVLNAIVSFSNRTTLPTMYV